MFATHVKLPIIMKLDIKILGMVTILNFVTLYCLISFTGN